MCVMGSCLELISSLVWIPSLQVILYHDDVEICNPLGASVKAQAWCIYFTLGNLQPRNRSLLHAIQLLALAKTTTVIQSYDIDTILEPFMQSIKNWKM